MKITKKKHFKVVATLSSVVVVAVVAGLVYMNANHSDKVAQNSQKVAQNVAPKIEKTEPTTSDTPVAQETQTATIEDAPPTDTQTSSATDAKAILSTQEYGEKYLDLSNTHLQQCFNDIVAAFPDRFAPEVREHNVQALRIFSSVCSVGFTLAQNPHYPTILMAYGKNGEFFDSNAAKSQWQD